MESQKWDADDITDEHCNGILHGFPPWTQRDREIVAAEFNRTHVRKESLAIRKSYARYQAVYLCKAVRAFDAVIKLAKELET
jgi:hypothetical protein